MAEWKEWVDRPHEAPSGDSSAPPPMLASLAEPERAGRPPRRAPWTARLVVAATALLVLGPILALGLPAEISRWYEAAAIEKRLDGDLEGAIETLDQALRWRPHAPSVYLRRAEWKLQRKDYRGALADYDRAIQLAPHTPQAYIWRSRALQHLGRHQEAIADWHRAEQYQDGAVGSRASMLNGLAYAQALGNTELDQALENVETALRYVDSLESLLKPDPAVSGDRGRWWLRKLQSLVESDNRSRIELELIGTKAAMLDTRGYIQLLRGELEAAQRDLDEAVKLIEVRLERRSQSTDYIDRREFELEMEEERQSAAVIHYHRALLYDRLGQTAEADRDRERIRQLGYEPGSHLF